MRIRTLNRLVLGEIVAVPALLDIIVALLAVLVFLAAEIWAHLLKAVFGRLPLIGGKVSSEITGWFNDAESILRSFLSEQTRAFAWLVNNFALTPWRWMNSAVDAVGNVWSAAEYAAHLAEDLVVDITKTADAAVSTAEAAAQRGLDALGVTVGHEISSLAGNVTSDLAHLSTTLLNDLTAVESKVIGDVNSVANTLTNDITSLSGRMTNIENLLIGDVEDVVASLTKQLAGAEVDARNAANAAESAAVALAGTAAAALTSDALAALDTAAHDLVIGPWDALLPKVEAIVQGLSGDVTAGLSGLGDLVGAIPATVPGILAALGVAVGVVAAEVEDCVVPNCANVNALSALMNALSSGAEWALLVALLAGVVSDPAGASKDIVAAVQPLGQAALGGVESLIGL
jgi:hypothetical protein